MASPLPSNFTIVEADDDGKTIRELAMAVNVAYLTPYYLVQRKENISVPKDVIAVTETNFYQGADARNHLGIPVNKKTTIQPASIPAGTQVFVQSSSHNRKIPLGSKVLLQTAVAPSEDPPVVETAPAAAPATPSRAPATTTATTVTPPAPSTPPPTRSCAEPPNKRPRLDDDDDDDDGGDQLGTKVLRLRLNREGARSCEALQASLIWNDIADLDLSCITPDGTTIYYGNKESECGGWLDVDMNVQCSTASTEPVENIFWASAPSGKYIFRVTNFNCHTDPDRTVFVDPKRSVPYRVFLTRNGKKDVFDGSVKHKEVQTCFEFELEGEGALGSFVVMPPADTKTTFKQACEANGVTYTQGSGYYALCRMENISQNKVMLLQNIDSDTFTIGAEAVRNKLGWPVKVKQIRKGPKDIPAGHRLFVQSTSHNRLIPPGTHTLMKVSVKEALKHRAAHNTRFTQETHTMGTQQQAAAVAAANPNTVTP